MLAYTLDLHSLLITDALPWHLRMFVHALLSGLLMESIFGFVVCECYMFDQSSNKLTSQDKEDSVNSHHSTCSIFVLPSCQPSL
jgi:hypothetical protein